MFKIIVATFVVQLMFSLNSFADSNKNCLKLTFDQVNTVIEKKPALTDVFVDAYSDPGVLVNFDLDMYKDKDAGPNIVDFDEDLKSQLGPNVVDYNEDSKPLLGPNVVYYKDLHFYVCTNNKKGWDYDIVMEILEDGRGTVLEKVNLESEHEALLDLLLGPEKPKPPVLVIVPPSPVPTPPKPSTDSAALDSVDPESEADRIKILVKGPKPKPPTPVPPAPTIAKSGWEFGSKTSNDGGLIKANLDMQINSLELLQAISNKKPKPPVLVIVPPTPTKPSK